MDHAHLFALTVNCSLSRCARPQRGKVSREAGARSAIGHWLVQPIPWNSQAQLRVLRGSEKKNARRVALVEQSMVLRSSEVWASSIKMIVSTPNCEIKRIRGGDTLALHQVRTEENGTAGNVLLPQKTLQFELRALCYLRK
jgi:hypothetical protein